MYIVTGATGKLGGMIVERLLAAVPAGQVGVSVRDPGKAEKLAKRGVRVRRGDFADPGSLAFAFKGVSRLMLVSPNAAAYGGDAGEQARAAIDAAREAGAERVFYTSHMGVGATSVFAPMRDHAAAEALLSRSGLRWTALRNGFYAETIPMLIGDAATTGEIAAPADGPVSWTTHEDLAEAAVALFTATDVTDGPTPPLTASQAVDLCGCASILSAILERPVSRATLGEDEFAAKMAEGHAPHAAIEMTLALFRAARAGEFSAVDGRLRQILGRDPTPVSDVLKRVATDHGYPSN